MKSKLPVPEVTAWADGRVSRRDFLKAGTAAGLVRAFAISPPTLVLAATGKSSLLGFEGIEASTADTVRVPEGYQWRPLISWGDPLFPDAPAFDPSGHAPAADQARQFGDNNDGMELFPLSSERVVLAVNNEYTNYEYLFSHRGDELSADDVLKAQYAVGVSIVELGRGGSGEWVITRNSPFNRRIHALTPIELTGPVAGHALVKTDSDPLGIEVRGTALNCAGGRTPWNTYLSCEEKFSECFGSSRRFVQSDRQARYGIRAGTAPCRWHVFDERFDIAAHPNEPNRFGWVVEVDPLEPESKPRKRTALGRLMHENAALHVNRDGRVVVYMGDDARGEHLYRFVSRNKFVPGDAGANRDLLDEGTLSVARFDARPDRLEGTGQWIELEFGRNGLDAGSGFADQAEVLLFARLAATRVGATTLDRPEWVAVHPGGQQVYCALTGNDRRGNDGQPVGGPNPRARNLYGQILRWKPDGDDHAADTFTWDLYVVAGNPLLHDDLYGGTDNINPGNMFNGPDGLTFDSAGRLWIQTDGNYSDKGKFRGMGNNQMLCGDPETGEIRRFMTGPRGCEITGLAFSPDSTAMFVGIQHPGEGSGHPSRFPGSSSPGGGDTPRSTVVVVTRRDGGIIGS